MLSVASNSVLAGTDFTEVSYYSFYKQTVLYYLLFCKENSVKKWQLRFDVAKATLLRCKTYAFTVQNSRFWNAKQ